MPPRKSSKSGTKPPPRKTRKAEKENGTIAVIDEPSQEQQPQIEEGSTLVVESGSVENDSIGIEPAVESLQKVDSNPIITAIEAAAPEPTAELAPESVPERAPEPALKSAPEPTTESPSIPSAKPNPSLPISKSVTKSATTTISIGTPNQTLYVQNLNDKIQKEELKKSLYLLFSTYGHIIDIVALKTSKMRGQAHIAFANVGAATLALKALQGFRFFGKEMNIAYAKSKSDAIAKLDGTYTMPTAPSLAESKLPLAPFESNESFILGEKRSREKESEVDDY